MDRRLYALLAVIFSLFFFAIMPKPFSFPNLSRDIRNEETYCAAQNAAPEKHYDRNCESFWYRTFFDPSIAWNFYYSCLTFALVIAAAITVSMTIVSARRQREITEDLFREEQRPWLTLKVASYGPLTNENALLRLVVAVTVENVGKSTARNVNICVEMFGGNFLQAEKWFFDLIKKRMDIESSRTDTGSLLAPTETESGHYHVGEKIDDIITMQTTIGPFISPSVAVILTYRGVDERSNIKFTARNFSIIEIRPGYELPFAIDPARLPIQNVALSSYPKHARAT